MSSETRKSAHSARKASSPFQNLSGRDSNHWTLSQNPCISRVNTTKYLTVIIYQFTSPAFQNPSGRASPAFQNPVKFSSAFNSLKFKVLKKSLVNAGFTSATHINKIKCIRRRYRKDGTRSPFWRRRLARALLRNISFYQCISLKFAAVAFFILR